MTISLLVVPGATSCTERGTLPAGWCWFVGDAGRREPVGMLGRPSVVSICLASFTIRRAIFVPSLLEGGTVYRDVVSARGPRGQ